MSEKLANAAPLGLLGFGLTTVLLNLVNIGLFPLDAMILAMGLVYGGIAQVIVGIMEYRRGNTFGTTTFTSYGLFWLSLVILIVLPNTAVFTGINTPTGTAMGAYFIMWGLFSFAMFFGTLKANRALQFVFISVTVLFFLLAARDLTGNATLLGNFKIDELAGYEGIICGSSAIYLGIAEVLNEVYNKTVMPIGAITKIPS
jgi:succinate-acetate transporter protein